MPALIGALAGLLAAAAPTQPRWAAGLTLGLAQVEGGAAEREEAIAYGV